MHSYYKLTLDTEFSLSLSAYYTDVVSTGSTALIFLLFSLAGLAWLAFLTLLGLLLQRWG